MHTKWKYQGLQVDKGGRTKGIWPQGPFMPWGIRGLSLGGVGGWGRYSNNGFRLCVYVFWISNIP